MLRSKKECGSMAQSEFEEFLLGSIDSALGDILGERFKETFYRHIEQKFHVTRSSLSSHLDLLESAMSTVLGETPGVVLGRAVAKRLYARLGLQFVQRPNYSLDNYVSDARAVICTP